MRACFYIGPNSTGWCGKIFPEKSPGELLLAGKSWCRHLVDQCSRLGVSDIYIADCCFYEDLSSRMGDGAYWSLNLHYLAASPCDRAEQLLKQYEGTIPADEDLLIFWGQVLPDVPDMGLIFSDLREVTEMPEKQPDGIWLLRGGRFYECLCPLFRMRTLREYFDLNFQLLESPGIYNLPGYSNSDGCVFGMDVIMMPDCELESPVLIADNVRLERGVSLRRKVIVGQDVLINEDSHLEHTIVMDHTCIGKHMFFEYKIIDGSRVIDVLSGASVDLDDGYLTGSAKEMRLDRYMVTEFLLAFLLAVGGLPVFLLTWPFRRQLNKLALFFFASQAYPKCWQVLCGRARLIRYGRKNTDYAFRYSDQWLVYREEHQKDVDDMYFYHNRTVAGICRIVFVSLLKRCFVLGALPCDDRSGSSRRVAR